MYDTPPEVQKKRNIEYYNSLHTQLMEKETEAARVIKNFFEKMYNGNAQSIIDSLHLTDIVEVRDSRNSITCIDISSRTTTLSFPSNIEFLALREISKKPYTYDLIIYSYTRRKLTEKETYHFEGEDQLRVLADVAKKAIPIEESIRKTLHSS